MKECTDYLKNGFWRESQPEWAWSMDIFPETKNEIKWNIKKDKKKEMQQTPVYEINLTKY